MKKHKIHGKNNQFVENYFSQNAATALGPSSKDRARCEVSAGIKDLSVRPLSVEL